MHKRKPAVSIGVYFNKFSRKITHVKVPDFEDELDNPACIQKGEVLLRVPIKLFGTPTHTTLHHFVTEVEKLL